VKNNEVCSLARKGQNRIIQSGQNQGEKKGKGKGKGKKSREAHVAGLCWPITSKFFFRPLFMDFIGLDPGSFLLSFLSHLGHWSAFQ
jgi:hypothetical protein